MRPTATAVTTVNKDSYLVYGTVRDQYQRPLQSVEVRAFDKDIRSEQPLGEPVRTSQTGAYEIPYALAQFAATDKLAADVIVRVYGQDGRVLNESPIHYNAPRQLRVDLDLSGKVYRGPSEFEQTYYGVLPYTGALPLAQLTEDQRTQDITFLTNKTGLARDRIEALAMAYHFEQGTKIQAYAFYALVRVGLPSDPLTTLVAGVPDTLFAAKMAQTFDGLLRENIDTLMAGLRQAIDTNIAPFAMTADLPRLREALLAQQQLYLRQHPQPSGSPASGPIIDIAGLRGDEISTLLRQLAAQAGPQQALWTSLAANPSFQAERADLLQSIATLAQLTGEHIALTEQLITTQNVRAPGDVAKLAAYTSQDWARVLASGQVQPPASTPGRNSAEKAQHYAAQLERTFTSAYPTQAFTARLRADTQSKSAGKDAIAGFLSANPTFDLLTTRIGRYVQPKAAATPGASAPAGPPPNPQFVNQLKRVQRVFKLAPTYAATNALLNDGVDSAQKIYQMGRGNFVRRYGPALGAREAKKVFQRAKQAHAQALALAGNLRSMSDASLLGVFPNYTPMISDAMSAEVPDLDALIGHHSDICACEECRSVYGAPAYLTDLLHYLDNRMSDIPCAPGKTASLRDVLLRRRPDIGDIDLECNNTNTTIPYIDIVNEVLESFIALPGVTLDISYLPKFVAGQIDAGLYAQIVALFNAAGPTNQSNIADLLTSSAAISERFQTNRLQDDDTCVTEDHWMIRDQFVVLKATNNQGINIGVQLVHQTLLSSDEINANPEYTNAPVYNTVLSAAKRPFTLPFDLYETESELYLAKLGTNKADLIDAFRQEHLAGLPPTQADLDIAYAYLKVNNTERTLIFSADPGNQSTYWGTLAGGTSVRMDLFEQATGLTYEQVEELITLVSINPTLDTVIVSDAPTCDTTQMHLNNLTPTKFDMIHRFLRLWRKTSFSLKELDALVHSPAFGNGAIQPSLAWQLVAFLRLQQLWSFSVFQLLALFQPLDISADSATADTDNQYNQLFQNRALTNPPNPDFAIAKVSGAPVPIADPQNKRKKLIQGALGLAPSDLDTLIAKTDGKLSLDNLSYFYRMVQVSQALSLSVADLLTLLDLINMPPITDGVTTNRFKDPVTMTQLNDKWRTVVSSRLAVSDLNYVLRYQNDASGSLVASDDLIATGLSDLQGKLLQVRAATTVQPDPMLQPDPTVQPDPQGRLLKKWLTDPLLNWDSRLADKLLDILGTQDNTVYGQKVDNNDTFLLNLRVQYHDPQLTADLSKLPPVPPGTTFAEWLPGSLGSQLFYDAANKRLQLIGYMSAADHTALVTQSGPGALQAAADQLFSAQQTSNAAANILFASPADITASLKSFLQDQLADRYTLLLYRIAPTYAALQQQSVVQNEICAWFKINKDVAAAIEAAQPSVYTDFTGDPFVNKANPLTSANYAAQFNWYRRIATICFLVAKMKLNASDLTWLFAHVADITSLDLWNLPIAAITGPVTTFDAFAVLVNVLKFEQRFPAGQLVTISTTTPVSVYSILEQVIDGDTIANIEASLSALTGWDQTQLDDLINAPNNYLNLTLAPSATSDLKDIRILLRLARCFTILGTLRVTAADCVAWTHASLTIEDAAKIKQTLKAQTQADQWLHTTQPLQDGLREAKRDALVAYLLANPPAGQTWQDSTDLYSYFLLDVEMSACLPTSRIVQATNSVQVFVQRCFLHLEAHIIVDQALDPDWAQWQWMKAFRLWQANVKVFVRPENWIEPDLLPTTIKSPFFSELQSELLQNDVTKDNVETAFLNYLEKLDGVSRLEVKAMWYEDAKKTLHVVARTYGGDPKIYYYRRFIQNRRWTPWVKIDQDIATDHLVLTVFNDRLYLFWAVFTEKSYEVDSVTLPALPGGSSSQIPVDHPAKYWQIQLAFTEYKSGKWTPKKVSNNDATGWITVDQTYDSSTGYTPDKADFVFTPLDIPAFDPQKYFNPDGTLKDPGHFLSTLRQDVVAGLSSNGDLRVTCYLLNNGQYEPLQWTFDLDPCKGYPVVVRNQVGDLRVTLFDRSQLNTMLDTEQSENADTLALTSHAILGVTPGTFRNLVPLQMGFIDRLMNLIYRLIFAAQYQQGYHASEMEYRLPVTVGTFMPFFYQDAAYTYYVQPEFSDDANFEFTYSDLEDLFMAILEGDTTKVHEILATIPNGRGVAGRGVESKTVRKRSSIGLVDHFFNFYHPMVCFFIRTLYNQGVDGLMARTTQLKGDTFFDPDPGKFDFNQTFEPTGLVYTGSPVTYNLVTDPHPGYPKEDVDFDMRAGYSAYNWELFFRAPLMLAERLSQNLQFEDADHWFKYIFNPTDASRWPSPDKYWVTKPFFINVNDKYTQQQIENIMLGINDINNPNHQALVADVSDWRNNPFQPHYIAEYRTVAYQLTTVMKYLDHLIAWGDNLFRQDTMESVTSATQLYLLASHILGPRPQIIAPADVTPVDSYYQLEAKLDAFSNALVDIENLLPMQQITGYDGVTPTAGFPTLSSLYFCIPQNDKLLGYWDTIANRLFNIRHCLNIDGKFAPPALFAPPIDPGLLVRAAAAGLDIGSILSDMNSPLPNYRFSVMIQKAIELCNEVKSLGSALLQGMEKKDAEDLALLRSTNGLSLLNAVLTIKQKQVDDATHTLEGLQKQRDLVQMRHDHYQGLITAGLNNWEAGSLALTQAAIGGEQAAVVLEYLGNVLSMIPDFNLGASGFGGSPHVAAKFGGQQLGEAMRAMTGAIRGTAGVMHSQANVSSTQATYERRKEDWQFQVDSSSVELEQLDKQILAAEIKLDIANQDVQNQQLQITNAQAEDDFMHQKFTNTDLYSWMIGQISTIYFQSYQLAYALAKQAEQTFRYELALGDSKYITFGYWDSLKKGLLAGDQLLLDIRTMDKAYHDQNLREYELTKHISLAQLDPSALQSLKNTGACWLNLPEELFDMDYPGHYMRRVKSVSLTLPCVAGPYTTISCTLTLTRDSMRTSTTSGDPNKYPRKVVSGVPADDPRFRDRICAIQSIATSTAQNDDGLFEMNFRDERYLPFEGAGAISQWHLKLPAAVQQFDYQTISDVVMHLRYTSRDGGDGLALDAATSLLQLPHPTINSMLVALSDTGLMRVFSAKHEYPTEWYAFLNPTPVASDQVLNLNISRDRFPYFAAMATNLKITAFEVIAVIADSNLAPIHNVQVVPAAPVAPPYTLAVTNRYTPMASLNLDYTASKKDPGTWTITNPASQPLTADQLNDVIVIVHYEVS